MEAIKNKIEKLFTEAEYNNKAVKEIEKLLLLTKIDNKKKQILQGHLLNQISDDSYVSPDQIKYLCRIFAILENADNTPLRNEVYFSPGNDCRNAILKELRMATKSAFICVFTISDDLISQEILNCKKRGISIKVITDNDKSFDCGSDIEDLANQGVPVKMDTSPNHMHHKFAIIDESVLITGSYNWTRSAYERNQENILITNSEDAIGNYMREFNRLWTAF